MKFSINKNDNKTIYEYKFYNLTDLYDYLINDPKVNSEIFKKQISKVGNDRVSGIPYEDALEYLKGGYNINFEKFDISLSEFSKLGNETNLSYDDLNNRNLERCIHGGVYLSPLVAAGIPDCMVRYKKDTNPKQVTIYFQLAFPYHVTENQAFNRGVATINLIKLLEKKGYIVDLKAIFLLRNELKNEFFNLSINLKQPDEYLNISRCFYPFVSREFVRRIIFRVLESTPVEDKYWGISYGLLVDNDKIREFYKTRKKDLVIPSPSEMELIMKNTYLDTMQMFRYLNLDEEFDLSKNKQKIKKI